jgi:hypothetical protein
VLLALHGPILCLPHSSIVFARASGKLSMRPRRAGFLPARSARHIGPRERS